MCELFGVSSGTAVDIRAYLRTFYRHSIKHPHGWGLMRETENGNEIIKEPVSASGSRIISEIIEKTAPQTTALAHIRLATVGSVKPENCHPYTGVDNCGRTWTMIHNGTVYSGKMLTKYLNIQKGDTDSERVFLCILDEINRVQEGTPLSAPKRFEVIEQTVAAIAPRNKLNLMIYDGELLYVHKNMRDTLSYKLENNTVYFSTVPLDNSRWEDYPLAQLCAFKGGKKVITGTKHSGIFIPTLEYITAMDAMNI